MTNDEKRAITEDFKIWSGGFRPDECDEQQFQSYAETARDSKHNMGEVLEFLRQYRADGKDSRPTGDHAQLFPLGQLVATPGVLRALEAVGEVSYPFIARHARLDPGCLSADDQKANKQALKDGSRIWSAFMLKDGKTKIWIITEAVNDQGTRASTCILLPDEY